MKNFKTYYRNLKTIPGYVWQGYWDGLHHFVKGNYQDGFLQCSVLESEIADGSYLFMMEKGLTR